jgi:hypothetical protein
MGASFFVRRGRERVARNANCHAARLSPHGGDALDRIIRTRAHWVPASFFAPIGLYWRSIPASGANKLGCNARH